MGVAVETWQDESWAQGGLEPVGPVAPRHRALPQHDHDLGIEGVDDAREGSPEEMARLAEDPGGAGILRVRGRTQGLDAALIADHAPLAGDTHERRLADVRLQAAVVAAGAERTAVGDGDVADLA